MHRPILLALAAIHILTGLFIFFAPQAFYDNTPGLSLMGPFSIHFIRDVALAFLASGGAMAWGVHHDDAKVALAGAAWPILHALFHVQIWGMRGFPFDFIFFFDVGAVMIPAFAGGIAGWKFRNASAAGVS